MNKIKKYDKILMKTMKDNEKQNACRTQSLKKKEEKPFGQ